MLESKLWTLNSYSEAPLCLVATSENNVVAVPVFEDLQQNGIEALQPCLTSSWSHAFACVWVHVCNRHAGIKGKSFMLTIEPVGEYNGYVIIGTLHAWFLCFDFFFPPLWAAFTLFTFSMVSSSVILSHVPFKCHTMESKHDSRAVNTPKFSSVGKVTHLDQKNGLDSPTRYYCDAITCIPSPKGEYQYC